MVFGAVFNKKLSERDVLVDRLSLKLSTTHVDILNHPLIHVLTKTLSKSRRMWMMLPVTREDLRHHRRQESVQSSHFQVDVDA
jgi:hypothetical protein